MRYILITLLVTIPAAVCAQPLETPTYDLLIRNGKIIDGSGNPWYHADLAIRGDKIAAIGKLTSATAKRTIDAKGLVVAPGFIDIHSHSDFLLLEDGNAESKIRQGVTTEVLGEGRSAGPYQGKLLPPRVLVRGKPQQWTRLGDYFDLVEKIGVSTNVASFVGLDTVWESVMGKSHARPTAAQLEKMKKLIEEAMKDGAAGLSCQLMVPAGSLATTDDIVELCKVVAKYGGIFVVHVRNEGIGVFESIREAIEIGWRAGIQVEILHIKIADQQYWGQMNKVVSLINKARQNGVNVQANVYPYTRGHNNLRSIIPPWAHEGGTKAMLDRLKDPQLRRKIKENIRKGLPGWYNHYTAVGGDWSRIQVTGSSVYSGLTMDRVLAELTKGKKTPDKLDAMLDLLIDQGGSVPAIFAHHSEKDMQLVMQQPWCGIGSDGLAYAVKGPLRRDNPHPRSFGTFPRVLGVYVRELKLFTLEEAIRKMTSLNAAKIGLQDRGLLRVGYAADITLFDPDRVCDKSTYTDPFHYSVGIEYVIVNGEIVLNHGVHTGAHPGKALRHQQ